MVKITEELLIKAGGWPVMKEARAIHAGGRVSGVSYEGPLLRGLVQGGQAYASGLRILSASDVESLCGCVEARRRGVICAHAVAVGLEYLKPTVAVAPVVVTRVAKVPVAFTPQGTGPEVRLAVTFAPNFLDAWGKNAVTWSLEASVGETQGSKPFGTLDVKGDWRCGEEDAALAGAVLAVAGGATASALVLTREQSAKLLEALTEHPRIMLGKARRVQVLEARVSTRLLFTKLPDGGLQVAVADVKGPFLKSSVALWRVGDTAGEPLVLERLAPGLPGAYLGVFSAPVVIPAVAVEAFIEKEVALLAGFFECEGITVPPPKPPAAAPRLSLLLEGSLNHLEAKFKGEGDEERLRGMGFASPNKAGAMVLKEERNILGFFAVGLPQLQAVWDVELGERFTNVTEHVERGVPHVEIRGSGEQWFDLAYDVRSEQGEVFSAGEMQRLLESGQSHVRRASGKVVVFDPQLLDDFSNLLRDSQPTQQRGGAYRLDRRQAGALQAFAEDSGLPIGGDGRWREWAGAARRVEALEAVPLGDLEVVLRPYQKQGVAWLSFLAQNHFGGILADDMGLGKTLQTLAFLRGLQGQGPCLIVAPSSLLFNWRAEATQWTPELRVLVLEGGKRDLAGVAAADLVITSYPLLRLDVEEHRAHYYAAIVLDEAQHIKNPESQNARAAVALRGRHRFALTGTPIENSVTDLWSVMQFALPGYLGSRKEFKERYEQPMSRGEGGRAEGVRLKQRLRPFLLRRLKQEVAADLPTKIEQVAWCELTPTQRGLYTSLAEATRRQLSELSGEKDRNKYRMVALTALLRLRQASCDLRLLPGESPAREEEASAKLDMLMELVEEAAEGGHRVLVFSQFVKMLGLIRERLTAAGMDYCYLDGSTRDRAGQVQRFQSGQVPVFLISLKAGGTGLNLTAADTVMHFDPWWNPAVEAQATDRAHRIGQTRPVTSYKLIARGTVEEKILHLQEKKKGLTAAVLENEEPTMEGLSLAEIEELIG